MSPILSTLEIPFAGGRLRLAFVPWADRVAQRISLELATGGSLPLLESVEGDARHAWPASPPLQQLHVERRGERQVALLVGLAGRSHWSASVEERPEDEALEFDCACRSPARPEWIGSRYLLAPGATLAAAPAGVGVTLAAGSCAIRLEAAEEHGAQIVAVGDGEIAIGCPLPAEFAGAATYRWKYRLRSESR